MANGRCPMHGGNSPGAPKGKANDNYRHGHYTFEAVAERRHLAELVRAIRGNLPHSSIAGEAVGQRRLLPLARL
jgi:hypothetical protein